jgi:hypothetical protein
VSELKCPFNAPLLSEVFACSRSRAVTRRGGPDVACSDAAAQARCQNLHVRLKAAVLSALGLDDDPLTTPHSTMVRIQCGGLLGLHRLAGTGAERIEDIDALVRETLEHYGGYEAVPVEDVAGDVEAYRIRKKRG